MNYKEVLEAACSKGYKPIILTLLKRFMYEGVQLHTEESLNTLSEYDTAHFQQCINELDEDIELMELILIQKWLRDEHNIFLTVEFTYGEECESSPKIYTKGANPRKPDEYAYKWQGEFHTKYEEALLFGIDEALRLL